MTTSPIPQGRYTPATRAGMLVFTAGMTPRDQGTLIMRGKVSVKQPIQSYREVVELAASNALRAAQDMLAQTERIDRVVNMTVYVAGEEGFEAHSRIADLASSYLFEQLGESGVGSRTAIGVYSLPGNAPVEISLVIAIAEQ